MLSVDLYDRHVGARLPDFFAAISPWNRRLWTIGSVLTLKEIIEASEAVQAGVLSSKALSNLISSANPMLGQDCGVGEEAQLKVLQQSLKPEVRYKGIEFHQIEQLIPDIEENYLERWANILRLPDRRPKVERTARAIASHLLDSGFDPDYLHRWWTYRIRHEAGNRSIADLVSEAHSLCRRPHREFEVIVAFEGSTISLAESVHNWLDASILSATLQKTGFETKGVRQRGGMSIRVKAREARSAVELAAEIIDRFMARVTLGTRDSKLVPLPKAWVIGEATPIPLRRHGRGVEVHALERENKLYPESVSSRVDAAVNAAIELLTPMSMSSTSSAVAGGWAAVEALLSTAGDDRVLAGDRMAALIACSFPRAELTALSYKLEAGGDSIAARLPLCKTNRDRAHEVAQAIRNGESLTLNDESDFVALERLRTVITSPQKNLEDINNHIAAVLRRLYRHRNMVLHWGKTDAVALRAGLRTAAPIVGEGMDRIAHAWFVENIPPLELAARASIRLGIVGSTNGYDIVDLLG